MFWARILEAGGERMHVSQGHCVYYHLTVLCRGRGPTTVSEAWRVSLEVPPWHKSSLGWAWSWASLPIMRPQSCGWSSAPPGSCHPQGAEQTSTPFCMLSCPLPLSVTSRKGPWTGNSQGDLSLCPLLLTPISDGRNSPVLTETLI